MKCPIDHVDLVITERGGVEIDYCPKCRGVWLDRGELDKIIERSAQSNGPSQVQTPSASYRGQASLDSNNRDRDYRNNDRDYRDSRNDYRDDDRKYRSKEYRDRDYRERSYRDDDYRGYDKRKSKKKKIGSFLEDLFDF